MNSTQARVVDSDTFTAGMTKAMSAGDEKAVDQFYRGYFDLLYSEARRATRRDEAFCLDVVQESVLKVIRSIRQVNSQAQLAAWLRLVVRTTAYDLLRRESRRRQREASVVPDASGPPDEEERSSQLEWLRRRITAFDPQLIQMIELCFTEQWRLTKIARSLGLSVATVDGRLRRALKHLRELAAEEFYE